MSTRTTTQPTTYDALLAWLEPRVEMLPDTPGCWLWTGARFPGGYGQLSVRAISSKPLGAHRLVYQWATGDPGFLHVLHRCHQPACVRPSHLYAGTRSDNMQDRNVRLNGRLPHLAAWQRREIARTTEAAAAVAARYGVTVRHVHRLRAMATTSVVTQEVTA